MNLMKIRGKKIPVRLPVPRPNRVHSTEKGARGYSRSDSRRMERLTKEGRNS